MSGSSPNHFSDQDDPIKSSTTRFDPLQCLPLEIVVSIFAYLPIKTLLNCTLVNKRWKKAACHSRLWVGINASKSTFPPFSLGALVQRGLNLLDVSHAKITGPIFTGAENKSLKLIFLNLNSISAPYSEIGKLLSCCYKLREVCLSRNAVTDSICHSLSLNNNLQSLDLSSVRGLTARGIISLCFIKTLCSLNLSWTYLDHDGFQALSGSIPRNIVYLNLSGNRDVLTDQQIISIVTRCSSLKGLDIDDSYRLSPEVLPALCRLLNKSLRIFSISRCYDMVSRADYLCYLTRFLSLDELNCYGLPIPVHIVEEIHFVYPSICFNKTVVSSVGTGPVIFKVLSDPSQSFEK